MAKDSKQKESKTKDQITRPSPPAANAAKIIDMEKIKFNPELESEGGKLYRQYCEEKGIDYSITAGANFCLGYMAEKKLSAPSLTPGPPTTTGTYFAVIKCYASDEPQMCVLHYQSHKNIYRAVGHAFNIEIKADDVVGYVGEKRGAEWVKASDQGIKNGEYVAKFKAPGIKLKHDFLGMAFVDEQYIHFVCPCHYDLKWAKGHEELQYVLILDESGTAAAREEDGVNPIKFHKWLIENHWEEHSSGRYWHRSKNRHDWPPDETCEESELITKFKQQKEK